MSYTTLELVRFTINKLNHCHNLSVSKPSFIGQPLWLRSGRHACVIFSLLCASGFSLLSLKQGSNSGMDDRSRFGSFPRRHLLFAEDTSTEQLRFARHLYHSDWVIRRKKKGYTYNRLSYYSNHVPTFNVSSLFAAMAIFIPIRVHKIVIGIWELAVRGATWRMQILGQMYLSFTPTQGVG